MLGSDVAELDALLSAELHVTTFLGQVISKQDDLAAHRSGFLKMHSIDVSERQITTEGSLEIVTCLAKIDATFDDDRTQRHFRFLRVWKPGSAGELQVIAGQATLVFE